MGRAARELRVMQRGEGATAELRATAYIVPGMTMTVQRGDQVRGELEVDSVPSRRVRLLVTVGDTFWLVKPGVEPPAGVKAIGCALEEGLASIEINHRVLFDDGHLETVVDQIATDHAVLRVTYAAGGSFKLAGEKGINLPDTELELPLFSVEDEEAFASPRAMPTSWTPPSCVAPRTCASSTGDSPRSAPTTSSGGPQDRDHRGVPAPARHHPRGARARSCRSHDRAW